MLVTITMRLVAVNRFYGPDGPPTGRLLWELAQDRARRGDDVHVVAGPEAAHDDAVRVTRLGPPAAQGTIAERLLEAGTFAAHAAHHVARMPRADVLLTTSSPPMLAAGLAALARARRMRRVDWVFDLYPEAAIELGALAEGGVAARGLRRVAAASDRHAARVVALSERMAARLAARGIARERIVVIPPWASPPTPGGVPPIAWPEGAFVALYSGNLGRGHDLATFLGAARRLDRRAPRPVHFAFVGHGARRAEAEALARGLTNVSFHDPVDHAALSAHLASAGVHLISLRDGLDGVLVPSKLGGALASARPVVFVGPDQAAASAVIRDHQLGWAGALGDIGGLVAALERLADDADACRSAGKRARAVYETAYRRDDALERFSVVLDEACR